MSKATPPHLVTSSPQFFPATLEMMGAHASMPQGVTALQRLKADSRLSQWQGETAVQRDQKALSVIESEQI